MRSTQPLAKPIEPLDRVEANDTTIRVEQPIVDPKELPIVVPIVTEIVKNPVKDLNLSVKDPVVSVTEKEIIDDVVAEDQRELLVYGIEKSCQNGESENARISKVSDSSSQRSQRSQGSQRAQRSRRARSVPEIPKPESIIKSEDRVTNLPIYYNKRLLSVVPPTEDIKPVRLSNDQNNS